MADTLSDVEVRAEGADVVVRIEFTVRVQYLRHVPAGSGDLLQIYFQIVNDTDGPTLVQETRKVPASALAPEFTVTYPLQPTALTKQLLVRFARPMRFRVRPGDDNSSLEVVLLQAAKPARPEIEAKRVEQPAKLERPVTKAEPAPQPAKRYAVVLDTFPTGDVSGAKPVPSEFGDYAVFVRKVVSNGMTRHQLVLGYFPSEAAAQRARQRLRTRFANAEVIDVSVPTQAPVTAKSVPVAPAAAPAGPQPAQATTQPSVAAQTTAPASVEEKAAALMAQGRSAMERGDNTAAIDALNQLLFLPPNRQSQAAQELVGVARERAGEANKARAEYELYLRLYPQGEGAERVRQRLAALQARPEAEGEAPAIARSRPLLRTVTGSVSQYYYDGTTKQNSAFNTPTTVDRSTLTSKDLSSLVTNVDLNARYRNDRGDTRLVFRDTNQISFLSSNPNTNRVNAAYLDYRGLRTPVLFRAGRQTAVSGGVNGRFDGVSAGWAFTPQWQLRVVGGAPAEYDVDSTRYFYGLNLEAQGLADRWSGDVFVINQMVDGITDRRAVGGELRYFDPRRTVYALLDYDVSYKTLNIAMLQGSWQSPDQTTLNVLVDRRKAPTLTTTNAVIGQPTTSIETLLQTLSEEEVRRRARAVTADVTQVLVSLTKPLTSRWQVGADFRLVNVGALPAVDDLPATPATGNIYGYTAQLIGNNLYSNRDINVFNATYQTGPTFHGVFVSYSNVTALNQKWTLEPSIRLYTQRDDLGVTLNRISPTLRLSYRLREWAALESEYTFEKSRTKSATQVDDLEQHFFSVGYRLDF